MIYIFYLFPYTLKTQFLFDLYFMYSYGISIFTQKPNSICIYNACNYILLFMFTFKLLLNKCTALWSYFAQSNYYFRVVIVLNQFCFILKFSISTFSWSDFINLLPFNRSKSYETIIIWNMYLENRGCRVARPVANVRNLIFE